MLSKITISIVFCLLISILSACQTTSINDVDDSDKVSIPTITTQETPILLGNTTTISLDSVIGIGEIEASKLCRKVIGEKSTKEKFGFDAQDNDLTYYCFDAVEYNGTQYYAMDMARDVGPVWSYISEYFVSVNGDEIYNGIRHSDDSYSIYDLVWSASGTGN